MRFSILSARSLVSLAILASGANAAPSPTGVTGTIQHGGLATVTGSGFGDAGNEVPLVYDDFEDGSPGSKLSTGVWTVVSDNGPGDPVFTNTTRYAGNQAGYADIRNPGDSAAYITGVNSESVYVSLRFRFRTDGSPTNQKGVRAHANDGPNIYTSRPNANVQNYATDNRVTISSEEEEGNKYSLYSSPNLAQNRWIRLEYFFQMSSPAGSDNGQIWVSHDRQVVENSRNINTRSAGVTDKYQLVMLPFYFGNGGGGELWYDDVYIGKTRARVEIGNDRIWSRCSNRAIQEPVSWSGNSIGVKLNLTGFGADDSLYLFVVGDDGSVSSGVQLEDVIRPLPPANFN